MAQAAFPFNDGRLIPYRVLLILMKQGVIPEQLSRRIVKKICAVYQRKKNQQTNFNIPKEILHMVKETIIIRKPDGTKKAFELNDENYITVDTDSPITILMKLSKERVSTAPPEKGE